MIAAANALSGDADLIAGTQLKVPEMAASKNDATSFRPYEPNEIVDQNFPEANSKTNGANSVNSSVPINSATCNVPLGFELESQFLTASKELSNVMVGNGIHDATIAVR